MGEYPRMLYRVDGRKTVARDEQHHAELAVDGFCALDKAGNLIQPAPVDPPISEAVRDMAEAHGIDWRTVEGSGQGGRVLKSDIQKLIDGDDQ